MNRAVLVAVIAGGLAAGWFGRAAQEPSRPQAILALFDRHCLPRAVAGDEPPLDGLDRVTLETGRNDWFDRQSGLILSRSDEDCSVSDRVDPMPLADAQQLTELARQLVSKSLPGLTEDDTNILGWDIFVTWHSGSPPGARRWGVTLFRTPDPDAETTLSLRYPPAQSL